MRRFARHCRHAVAPRAHTALLAPRLPQRALVCPLAMARRKSSGVAAAAGSSSEAPLRARQRTAVPLPAKASAEPPPTRRQSSRNLSSHPSTNPNANPDIVDGLTALRASPDSVPVGEDDSNAISAPSGATPAAANALTEDSSIAVPAEAHGPLRAGSHPSRRPRKGIASEAPAPASETAAADVSSEPQPGNNKRKRAGNQHVKVDSALDHADVSTAPLDPASKKVVGVNVDHTEQDDAAEGEDEVQEALSRPPPVNSDHLPLPWKGRIGYVRASRYCCAVRLELTIHR